MITQETKPNFTQGAITLWIAAGAPFFCGTILAPLIGPYGQQVAYDFGEFLNIVAILGTLSAYTLWKDYPKISTVSCIIFLLMFLVIFASILFVHDRATNYSESYCQSIGNDQSDMAGLSRAVVLDQGNCIKNETGFHANGKAIFS